MPFGGLLTVGLISAGAQLVGAGLQARSANKAAGQQVDASNQAKAELRPIYEGNVARMQPYANIGQQALGQLGALSGFPAQPPPQSSLGPMNGTQGPMNMSDPRVQRLAAGGSITDPGMSRMSPGQAQAVSGGMGTALGAMTGGGQSSYGTSGPGSAGGFQGRLVTLKAPTGEVGEFPEDQAQGFIARGAQRV